MRSRLSRDDGISIIEVVIAAGLFVLILFAVLSTLDSGTRTERDQQAQQKAIQSLRQAIARMTKETRQAVTIDPASTRSRLVMRTIVSGTEIDVVYEVNGSNEVVRKVNGSATGLTLVTRLTSADVFCFDPPVCSATGPTTSMTRVRISLASSPEVGQAKPITLATDVELRNL